MSRWRITLVFLLTSAPVALLAGLGSYYLWKEKLSFVVWWPMATCFILGIGLGWYWQRTNQLLRPLDMVPPIHWTDRDHEAWKLIDARAKAAAKMDPERLKDFQFYVDTARDMALEIARFFHPRARDPISSLTIPEILAAAELASHDLAELVDEYLPAGHLLTVQNWRQAKQASDWYQTFNNIYWLVSALINPVSTGLRFATSRLGMSKPLQLLQDNLIAWFYTAFVYKLGAYLIDLNSGRLRVGAKRYKELVQTRFEENRPREETEDPVKHIGQVTLTVFGQVKAGKSSFINAVLGEQRAKTNVIPETNEITRYELQSPGVSSRLTILDTVGYGHTGPREDQWQATENAAQQSDLLIMVMHARNPARQADLQFLERLHRWFQERPDLKIPPILGVLSHIDLLSPAMEWQPPYNWQEPKRLKEQQIAEALRATSEQAGKYLVGLVPLCTAAGRVYGVEEWFFPAMAELLEEARGVAVLRCLRAEADTGKVQKMFRQLLQAGKQAAKVALMNYQPR